MKENTFSRLLHLRADNDAARARMEADAPRFDALKRRHENGTAPRAVSSFNLFQTPQEIAWRMVELAHLKTGASVLEPSAGLGRIYSAIRATSEAGSITLIEQSADCCRELYQLTHDDREATLKQADFLTVEPVESFDAVVMNPPFERGTDVKHIAHALKFVKPGGVLVALCYNGTAQNKHLKPLCDSWELLPAGSFKREGTGADVVILTIKK